MNPAFASGLLGQVEDAGINASAPREQLWVDGWLVRFSPGKAKRARCVQAVASGRMSLDERLARCLAIYAGAGLRPYFRITPFSQPVGLDAQLAARGMEPGGQMYYNVGNQRQDALGAQSLQAFNQAGGEARAQAEGINKPRQQVWQNANTRTDQSNALRGAMYGEQGDMYNRQLGSIAALAGMGQSYQPNAPSFTGGQVNPFDISGAMMQNYGIKANNAAQTNAGIFSLGGGAMKMLSDRRAKTDIVPIGASLAGAPLYTFKYWLDGTTHVGVMADEVKRIHPDAVQLIGGFDHVDYAMLSRRHAA